jgi:hypothetical protein
MFPCFNIDIPGLLVCMNYDISLLLGACTSSDRTAINMTTITTCDGLG